MEGQDPDLEAGDQAIALDQQWEIVRLGVTEDIGQLDALVARASEYLGQVVNRAQIDSAVRHIVYDLVSLPSYDTQEAWQVLLNSPAARVRLLQPLDVVELSADKWVDIQELLSPEDQVSLARTSWGERGVVGEVEGPQVTSPTGGEYPLYLVSTQVRLEELLANPNLAELHFQARVANTLTVNQPLASGGGIFLYGPEPLAGVSAGAVTAGEGTSLSSVAGGEVIALIDAQVTNVTGGEVSVLQNAQVTNVTGGEVSAYGDARVSGVAGGTVHAYGNPTITTVQRGTVFAGDTTTVVGVAGGTVNARDQARVNGVTGGVVEASGQATVTGVAGGRVSALNDATVTGMTKGMVQAHHDAVITGATSGKIYAWMNVRIEASGDVIIYGLGGGPVPMGVTITGPDGGEPPSTVTVQGRKRDS